MSILVTGTPGSGKTTLTTYAKRNGDNRFYDADEIIGLCEWREFKTSAVLGPVNEHAATGDDWYKKYGWYWKVDRLKQFLAEHPGAIICGSSENVTGCYKLFKQLIIIRITEAELLHNLASPERSNPFGKTTKQHAGFLNWQDHLIRESQMFSPIFIDGNTIDTTYDKVLAVQQNTVS